MEGQVTRLAERSAFSVGTQADDRSGRAGPGLQHGQHRT